MNRFECYLSLLIVGTILLSCKKGKETDGVATEVQKPNIIYILADDLGYAEVGAYGQERIETPNIDALAKSGILFTQHYTSAPVCAPARYMLLTGKHAGHAYIRSNSEWGERGDVWNYIAMAKDSTLEGQGPMPDTTITLAHRLKRSVTPREWSANGAWARLIRSRFQMRWALIFSTDTIVNDRHIPITHCISTKIEIGCIWPMIRFHRIPHFPKGPTRKIRKAMLILP